MLVNCGRFGVKKSYGHTEERLHSRDGTFCSIPKQGFGYSCNDELLYFDSKGRKREDWDEMRFELTATSNFLAHQSWLVRRVL